MFWRFFDDCKIALSINEITIFLQICFFNKIAYLVKIMFNTLFAIYQHKLTT